MASDLVVVEYGVHENMGSGQSFTFVHPMAANLKHVVSIHESSCFEVTKSLKGFRVICLIFLLVSRLMYMFACSFFNYCPS